MFANTFQSGFISIFYSVGSKPLELWDKQVKNGHIRRVVDDEVRSLVLEISGTNVATTYITCPIKPRQSLGIKLPFLVMIIKNMKKYFTFEIQILDDKNMHRRFRVSNFQSTTKVRPFCTTMPIGLSSGWNQVQFNLADFTKRAYGSTYLETTRVQIHANIRIRRIYFSDILYSDDELPNEYKLFMPTPGTQVSKTNTIKAAQQKKKPDEKTEKKESKKLSAEEIKIQMAEKEIPSGAPPSPAGPPGAVREEIAEPVAVAETVSPVATEPPTETGKTETSATAEETITEDVIDSAPSEAPSGASETVPSEPVAPIATEPAQAAEAPKDEVVEEPPPEEVEPPPPPTEPPEEAPAAEKEETPSEDVAPTEEAPPS